MRYLIILSVTQPSGPPPEGLMEAILQLGADAEAAGSMIDNAGLLPSATGAQIVVVDGRLRVADGPFGEAEEYLSYAVFEVAAKHEAVEWASRFMQLHLDRWPGWSGRSRVLKILGPEDMPPMP